MPTNEIPNVDEPSSAPSEASVTSIESAIEAKIYDQYGVTAADVDWALDRGAELVEIQKVSNLGSRLLGALIRTHAPESGRQGTGESTDADGVQAVMKIISESFPTEPKERGTEVNKEEDQDTVLNFRAAPTPDPAQGIRELFAATEKRTQDAILKANEIASEAKKKAVAAEKNAAALNAEVRALNQKTFDMSKSYAESVRIQAETAAAESTALTQTITDLEKAHSEAEAAASGKERTLQETIDGYAAEIKQTKEAQNNEKTAAYDLGKKDGKAGAWMKAIGLTAVIILAALLINHWIPFVTFH